MGQGVRMKSQVTADRDEDGVWIVECAAIPGCVTQGATREEALATVQDAIRECLQVRAERGLPLAVETEVVEVVQAHGGHGSGSFASAPVPSISRSA